jgi:uncharacterized repeat protein (TIGR01451 family)
MIKIANLLFSILISLFVTVSYAQAAGVDWLVNLNDTGSDPTSAGGVITHNISIINAGTQSAPANTFTFEIDSGQLIEVNGFTGCTPSLPLTGPNTVTCNITPLIPDGTQVGTIKVQTSTQAVLNGTISVNATGDDQSANNIASNSTLVIEGSNLSQSITGPTSAASGSVVTYSFITTNLGPNASTDAEVSIPLPVGFSVTQVPANCTLNSNTYKCPLPSPLNVNEQYSFDVTGQITSGSASTVTLLANAESFAPRDPIPENNTKDYNTTITQGSDVYISKSRLPVAGILVGDPVTFTLASFYTGDIPNTLSITDTVPSNYTISSVQGTGWTCSIAGQSVTCTRPTGTVSGNDVPLPPVQILTTATSVGTDIVNSANITSATPFDPIPANNTNTDTPATIVPPTVDLTATKTGPASSLSSVGGVYTYTLGGRNIGTAPFFGTVTMEDLLPEGMTIVSTTPNGWTCAQPLPIVGPQTYSCTLDYTQATPLGVNESYPNLALQIEVTQTGNITNNARVSSVGNYSDTQQGNNQTGTTTQGETGPTSADIYITKTATPQSVIAGDPITFNFEVVNTGPSVATNISIEDSLVGLINSNTGPTNSGFIEVTTQTNSASGFACSSAQQGTTSVKLACDISSLPICTPGVDCPKFTAQVRPGGEAGQRSNTVTAYSLNVADPNLDNNSTQTPYTVIPRSDLQITKVGAPDPATAGQNLTYVITALNINNNLSRAESVEIVDALPENVFFISAVPSQGTCVSTLQTGELTGTADTATCQLGTIANGSQQTIVVTVRPSNATRGTNILNTATGTTDTLETTTDNNTGASSILIRDPSVNLIINKTESVDPVAIGDDTVYTVEVKNSGPSFAENVTLTENFPATGLSYQSHTISGGGTCSVVAPNTVGATMTCSWPGFSNNQVETVNITMRGVTKGVAANSVSVTSTETLNGFETFPSDNTSTQNTTVRTRADMAVLSKTAIPTNPNVQENFIYSVQIINNILPNTSEADGVVVSDTLPSGMILTGTPTATITGSASLNTCTGTAGATQFQCAFGTVTQGTQISLQIPVKVTQVTSQSQTFTNNISVSTSSFDVNTTNNTNSGDANVNSSSLSGTVYRDFNEDAIKAVTDTGISGITMTLTGTSIDGTSITKTTQTDANGVYSFGLLPNGTYTIAEGSLSESNILNGIQIPGTSGGVANAGNDSINTINLGSNTQATGYNFTEFPQARLNIIKRITTNPTHLGDGTFSLRFQIRERNPSLESIINIVTTDVLNGASPNKFGTYTSLANPTTSPLAPGFYTVYNYSASNCGTGANPTYNGESNAVLGVSHTLTPGQICSYNINIRWAPPSPFTQTPSTARWENQASTEGTGQLSGQTKTTNPQMSDLSDSSTNFDPNNNGISNEVGENDPTIVNANLAPAIALVKSFDLSAVSSPLMSGDVITYNFDVVNTGNMQLKNVVVTDPLLGGAVGTPIATLNAGETVTVSGNYSITDSDIANNGVTNSATVQGTHTNNGGTLLTVSDTSGNAVTNNTPTKIEFSRIALVKTVDLSALSSPPEEGDILTYSFSIQNLGDITLRNVTVVETTPNVTLTGTPISTLPAGSTNTTAYSATYPITQADIDAGIFNNSASVSGEWGIGTSGTVLTSDISGTTTANNTPTPAILGQVSSLSLIKRSDISLVSTPAQINDVVSYTFEIENTGNTTLTNVNVTDILPGLILTGSPILTMIPGDIDTTTFTATYPISQMDIDAGRVENTAQVTGTSPTSTIISDTSGTDATNDTPTQAAISQVSSVTLVKTADDSALSSPPVVDDIVSYTFEITNTGNTTLTAVDITDVLLGANVVGGPIATFIPGAVDNTTITGTYALTQNDINAGFVENTATVNATDPNSDSVTDISGTTATDDTPTTTPITQVSSIALVKTADISAFSSPPVVDDIISYTFEITNTGNTTLTEVDVTDMLLGTDVVGGPIATLIPGVVNSTITGTYALTQSDINAGFVENTATVDATDPNLVTVTDTSGTTNTNDTPTTTPITQVSSIGLVKTADISALSSPPAVDDIISYTFEITNTGNTTLTAIDVTDVLLGTNVVGGPIATLIPGAVNSSITGTYALTQNDINAGFVENTATVDATDPDLLPVTDTSGTTNTNDTPTTTPITQVSSIALVKTADASAISSPSAVNDIISYTFEITNTGNTTLTAVDVTDVLLGANVVGGPIATLIPGAVDNTTITGTYALTQNDINAGFVENTATVDATDPNSDPITDISGTTTTDDTPTTTPISQVSSIALVKTADTSALSSPPAVDDIISYTFEITNTGNTTLTAVDVTDVLLGTNVVGGPIATLIPGAVDNTTITGTYALTQNDINAGFVENTATVDATDPKSDPITDISGTTTTDDTPTTTPISQVSSIALVKTADASALSSPPAVDDIISYTFQITNMGNTTLTAIDVTDVLLGTNVVGGPIATLIPGAVDNTTITGTYALTQNDIDAGFVENTATVDATDPNSDPITDISGTTTTDDTPTTTAISQVSSIALVKTANISALSSPPAVDDIISYTFEITNTGNTTLTAIDVTDVLLGTDVVGGPVATLIPGAVNSSITGTYALTQNDINAGFVENTATVDATDPNSNPVTDISGTTTTNDVPTNTSLSQTSLIRLVKTSNTSGLSSPPRAGETLAYTFEITNIGNTTLSNVDVTDVLLGTNVFGGPIPTLIPGSVNTTITGTYVLTQNDINAGFVENTATVNATDPNSGPVTDTSGTSTTNDTPTTTPITQVSSIALVKTADTSALSSPPAVNDIISYTFEITNTGNTTITSVDVTDMLLGTNVVGGPITTLIPGAVNNSITGTYALTQNDINAGFVENTATVNATDPNSDPVIDISGTTTTNDTPTTTPITQVSSIALIKTADVSALSSPPAIDDFISYTFEITNTGNTTLTAIDVTDVLLGTNVVGGPIATLIPGAVNNSITGTYALTQNDINAGFVENTAIVNATDPNLTPVTDTSGTTNTNDTPTTTAISQVSSVALVKTADVSALTTPPAVDDIISYTFEITNTGNTTLTSVDVTDMLLGTNVVGGPIATLIPGAVNNSITGTYALTQDDIDAGFVENTATVNATDPNSDPVTDISGTTATNDTPTTTPISQVSSIALVKTDDTSALSSPPVVNDVISYTFEITNTGNTTLTSVDVTDVLLGTNVVGGPIATLIPGAVNTTITGTYALTQNDINAGFVENTATVDATDPNLMSVTDISGTTNTDDIPTTTAISQASSIALVKTADISAFSSPPAVDDIISYTFEITNTGNTTLTSVDVTDVLLGTNVVGGPIATLIPGAVNSSITGTYALTQDDINAGFVENTATVDATDPNSNPITDISGTTTTDDTPTTTAISQASSIALIKTADISALSSPPLVDDIISYTFEITNTGNTTLTSVDVTDVLLGTNVVGGPIATLIPGAVDNTTISGTYALTQNDINAGVVENTATVDAIDSILMPVTDTSGATNTDDIPTTTPLTQTPRIALIKEANTSQISNPVQVGDVISYTFTITNLGNTSLTDVVISEQLAGAVVLGGPILNLDPQEINTSLTATYQITQQDIDAGRVENRAKVTGNSSGNPVTDTSGTDNENDDPIISTFEQTPSIELIKRADVNDNEISRVGDKINYTFEITNTGNTTLTNVSITDDLPGLILTGTPIQSLAPGEVNKTAYTAVYAVTAEDFVNLEVVNQAIVEGTYNNNVGESLIVTAPSGTDAGNENPTVVSLGLPTLRLDINVDKIIDVNQDGLTNINDGIVYSFTITNTGNIPLTNINMDMITLSLDFPNLVCTPISLPPGDTQTLSCTGNIWTITQEDVDRGSITLSGDVTGVSESGIEVSDTDQTQTIPVTNIQNEQSIIATKTANIENILIGDTVLYTLTFEFKNKNSLSLPIKIVDALPSGFGYKNGTAKINGNSVSTQVRGGNITFPAQTLRKNEKIVATLEAIALSGAGAGVHTNTTWAQNRNGQRLSNIATADVRIDVEPVFSCATVIGRVFVDRNHNGYYDDAQKTEETGLSGIRLVTPNGTAVFTDSHGRYSIPCGELPSNIGTNFQLKLDERTLPTGYVVTTENPRVVRLTAGMTTKLNFGANAPVPVDINLDQRAFNSGQVRPELLNALRDLVGKISNTPSVVRLIYHTTPGESSRTASQNVNQAERALRAQWNTAGAYPLRIDAKVVK